MSVPRVHVFAIFALLIPSIAVVAGCRKSDAPATPKAESPAKISNPTSESQLATITLTEKAEQRLGILIDEVRLSELHPRRTFSGEIVTPPGQAVVVSSPFAGKLSPPENGSIPAVGSQLAKDQAVFSLTPILTPEREVLQPAERVSVAQTKVDLVAAMIETDRQVEAGKITLAAAQLAYDRAQQLLSNKAGSQRTVEEANAQLQLAREALSSAESRQRFLSKVSLDEAAGQLAIRTITSPLSGVLQRIDAVAGEVVSASEPIFQVVQSNPIWVRVAVYAGLDQAIDAEQPATVTDLGPAQSASSRMGRMIVAPPSADPVAMTIDKYYELDNADGTLRPGQRVAVSLALKGNQQRSTVPSSAILYDIHGGAWVYELIETR